MLSFEGEQFMGPNAITEKLVVRYYLALSFRQRIL